ncbi:MAG: CBS domain-containing protein, partial [Candidatus Latescibacterota bacterium]
AEASVHDALRLMAEKRIGALPVIENGRVVGIFSERDYVRKALDLDASAPPPAVRELMTGRVLFVGPDDTVETCMHLMTEKRVRHLPVLDDERLVGLVSIGDVVKKVISEQEFTIRALEKYITGEK